MMIPTVSLILDGVEEAVADANLTPLKGRKTALQFSLDQRNEYLDVFF